MDLPIEELASEAVSRESDDPPDPSVDPPLVLLVLERLGTDRREGRVGLSESEETEPWTGNVKAGEGGR